MDKGNSASRRCVAPYIDVVNYFLALVKFMTFSSSFHNLTISQSHALYFPPFSSLTFPFNTLGPSPIIPSAFIYLCVSTNDSKCGICPSEFVLFHFMWSLAACFPASDAITFFFMAE